MTTGHNEEKPLGVLDRLAIAGAGEADRALAARWRKRRPPLAADTEARAKEY